MSLIKPHRRAALIALAGVAAAPLVALAQPPIVRGGLGSNAGRLWTPADVSVKPSLWLDATDASTITFGTGSAVATWADKSGNGNDATQGTAGSRPVYSATAINNAMPGIAANGSTQFMSVSAALEPGTIFAVVQPNSVAATNKSIAGGYRSGTGVSVGSWYFQLGQPTLAPRFSRSTTADNTTSITFGVTTGPVMTNGVPALFGARVTGSATKKLTLDLNGKSYGNGQTSTTLATLGSGLNLFAAQYGGSTVDAFPGALGAFLIFPTALSDVEMAKLVGYYAWAFGIQSQLAAGHPYKNSPPRVRSNGATAAGKIPYQFFGFDSTTTVLQRFGGATATTEQCQLAANYTVPDLNACRDPSVAPVRISGLWWMVHSCPAIGDNTFKATKFALACSPDLENWTFVKYVDCSAVTGTGSGAGAWAPELFVDDDGSVHVFVGLSTTANLDTGFQIYEAHPTTSDLSGAWSSPVAITGTSLPSNMIDPFMVKKAGTYCLFYKNEATKYVEYLTSSSLLTGYVVTGSGNWAGIGANVEGPIMQHDGTTWRLWVDRYSANTGYGYATATDDTWASFSALTSGSFLGGTTGPRHGSILAL